MAASLSGLFAGHKGRGPSFDAIRLIAALLVLYSHSFLITDSDLVFWISDQFSPGGFAVAVFFVLSGYVNAESYRRRPDARAFLCKRALRMYPALALVVAVTVLVLGPLATSLPLVEYALHPQAWLYPVSAIFPVRQVLPGVFELQPMPQVNGSLWTLRYEILCYAGLAVFGRYLLGHRKATLLLALALSVGAEAVCVGWLELPDLLIRKIAVEGLPLLAYFLGGVTVAAYSDRLPVSPGFVTMAVLAVILAVCSSWFWLIFPFAGAYTVSVLGNSRLLSLDRISRHPLWGDFSYGIYIVAFPVQQLVHWRFGGGWLTNLAISLPLVMMIAAILWHFVEKPSLRLKERIS